MPRAPILLTTLLMCPHGGMVKVATSANARVRLYGAPLLLASDFSSAQIAGCANQPPCVQVLWLGNPKVLICGEKSAWAPPAGVCMGAGPQGMVQVIQVLEPMPVSSV